MPCLYTVAIYVYSYATKVLYCAFAFQALTHVLNIEHRLKGILKSSRQSNKPRSVPLSIEGHVNYLLQEATDIKNLSQMYVGWAAFM